MTARACFAALAPVSMLLAAACASPSHDVADSTAAADSAFAQVQARGAGVMGVDQYASRHVFEDRPDGGRIIFEMSGPSDSAAVAQIRRHIREIVVDFREGDFTRPFRVHAVEVPGTRVMTSRRHLIEYTAVDRPGGAELRITTEDSTARAAIHEFLAFQRSDHRAAGHEGH